MVLRNETQYTLLWFNSILVAFILGSFMKPYIIADIGSNHRDDLGLAKAQIASAKEAGIDAVKFQFYTHRALYGFEGKAEYEMPVSWLEPLASHCRSHDIDFMCSAFSVVGYRLVDPFVNGIVADPEIFANLFNR